MKFLSLLKAGLSTDMNLFKYSTKKNSSKLNKILFPIMLFAIIAMAIGSYAFMIADQLAKVNLTYIMLTMFTLVVTILTFLEGIYKSQDILFNAKDNDLLFSLPIKKYQILILRISKLLIFQFLYNLMFLLPAFIVYIFFERPNINFYCISILMTILIPIIPTVVSSFIGYIVKLMASKFKAQKMAQTLLSGIVFAGVFYLSFNFEKFIANIAENATNINDIIIKIYYPIGLYINLIHKFNILEFTKLLLINIIPFAIFVFIGQKYYFTIISNTKITNTSKKQQDKVVGIKRTKINSLIRKELKRYFSSTVYMFNTSFGLILCLIATIALCVKGQHVFDTMFESYGVSTALPINVIFYFFILFACCMTSITSSSISLEGKTINLTKSLPIKEIQILNAKILTCYVIELPFILISELIFFITFKPSIIYIILTIGIGLVTIGLSGCIGLFANLKYPKMDASSDTEVVKQSMSSMISVFTGMGTFIFSALFVAYLNSFISLDLLIIMHFSILTIIALALYVLLMKFGVKAYRKI